MHVFKVNCIHTVALLKLLWTPSKSTNKPKVKVFSFHDSMEFGRYFDEVQAQLETLASMDDLLSGECDRQRVKTCTRGCVLINCIVENTCPICLFRNVKQV